MASELDFKIAKLTHRSEKAAIRSLIAVAIISILVFVALYPGASGFWGRDDFGVLAIVRLVGTPAAFFTTDHFPVGASVFRPLGFASMWLCEKLFGNAYAPNAVFDIALHLSVALMLYRLLLRAGATRTLGVLGALLFALHPAASGTSMWWSARFDLLCALFVLLALDAAIQYRGDRKIVWLLCALLSALAAMLSKEIGLCATVAVILVWANWAVTSTRDRRTAGVAIVLAGLSVVVFFAWRTAVLRAWSSSITGSVSLLDAFAGGLANWIKQAPGYFLFSAKLPGWAVVVVCACVVGACLSMYVGHRTNKEPRHALDVGITLGAACLLFGPVILQAPIAAFGSPLTHDMSAVEAAMQSRLYYLEVAGAVLMLGALIAPAWASLPPISLKVSIAFLSVLVAVAGWFSHRNARTFARRSVEISAVAREAVNVIDALDLPQDRCHMVFLGYTPAPEWSKYVSMDSIVKALTTNLGRVGHCWFHSNMPTNFYTQAAPVSVSDAAPYLPLERGGRTVPWRIVGDLEYAFTMPPKAMHADEFSGVPFFQYRDGHFVDVTHDVAAGTLAIELK